MTHEKTVVFTNLYENNILICITNPARKYNSQEGVTSYHQTTNNDFRHALNRVLL